MTPQHIEQPSRKSPFFFGAYGPAFDYMVDAAQRSILFWESCACVETNIVST